MGDGGDKIAAPNVEELVETYLEAWMERRGPARRRLLGRCWSPAGTYSSWTTSLDGLDALDEHISQQHEHIEAGSRLERTSELHLHEGRLSFTWAVVGPDGEVDFEGSEFAELDDEGRLARVTSFSGRPARRS